MQLNGEGGVGVSKVAMLPCVPVFFEAKSDDLIALVVLLDFQFSNINTKHQCRVWWVRRLGGW